MADIGFNAATDGGNNGGTTTSLTFSHTCSSNANRALIVGISGDSLAGVDDISSVTYNSVGMTLIDKTSYVDTDRFHYLYILLNPASGAHNVVVTASSTHYILAGAADYYNVKQTGQPSAQTTSSGLDPKTTSLTTVDDRSWVVLLAGGYNLSIAPAAGTGSTRRAYDVPFGTWGLFDSNGVVTPPGSYSMTTDWESGSPQNLAHILAALSPSPADVTAIGLFDANLNPLTWFDESVA